MEELQITFKTHGRRSLTAVIGRGATRFEKGTEITLKAGIDFTPPLNVTGGTHQEREYTKKVVRDWEAKMRDRWTTFKRLNPDGGTLQFKDALNSVGGVAEETHTLGSFIDQYLKDIENKRFYTIRKGKPSDSTVTLMKHKGRVIKEFIAHRGEDFSFSLYNSDTAETGDKAKVQDAYTDLVNDLHRYILEVQKNGEQFLVNLLVVLKVIIRVYAAKKNVRIDRDLYSTGNWSPPAPKKDNREDVFALNPKQVQWIIQNEKALRAAATMKNGQLAVDYFLTALFSCARRGDLERTFTLETISKQDCAGDDRCVRYVPEKTKNSSRVTAQTGAIPENIMAIFHRNLDAQKGTEREGLLLPAAPHNIVKIVKGILKKFDMFHEKVAYRDKHGVVKHKEIYKLIKMHHMRSTGITYLLFCGLSETEVKQISGHSPNSPSFNKYVKIFQQVINDKTKRAWAWKMAEAQPEADTSGALLAMISEMRAEMAELRKELAAERAKKLEMA